MPTVKKIKNGKLTAMHFPYDKEGMKDAAAAKKKMAAKKKKKM